MNNIRLDDRLSAVASLVEKCGTVADIGTDHAYLLCYLIENELCSEGIAADLRKGPLENARRTVVGCGLEDKIRLVLSDGLDSIPEKSADTVVLAGMGGILIKEILERTEWIYSKDITIVAQPMTHAEVLREFFCKNGFEILKEKTATDGKRFYCAMKARWCDELVLRNRSYYYLGRLTELKDPVTEGYINKMLHTLEKKLDALKAAGLDDNENLQELISSIATEITEV